MVDHERINQFADVTLDHRSSTSIPKGDPERYSGMVMGLNCGFDKVRFVSPVKVGKRIRCRR